MAHSRAVVRIVRQNSFCAGQRNLGGPSRRLPIPKRGITGNQHTRRSEIPLLQRYHFFKMANGLFKPLLSKFQKASTFVNLMRLGVEPKSGLYLAGGFVVTFFLRQYPGLDR